MNTHTAPSLSASTPSNADAAHDTPVVRLVATGPHGAAVDFAALVQSVYAGTANPDDYCVAVEAVP
jgi:hypothetical protein